MLHMSQKLLWNNGAQRRQCCSSMHAGMSTAADRDTTTQGPSAVSGMHDTPHNAGSQLQRLKGKAGMLGACCCGPLRLLQQITSLDAKLVHQAQGTGALTGPSSGSQACAGKEGYGCWCTGGG